MLHLEKLHDLSDLVAFVTGGGTGIGWMISHGLATNGAKVYIAGRRKDVLEKVANSWSNEKGTIIPVVMDVTSKESIRNARNLIEEREGKLHILVNNAGQVGPVTKFSSVSQDAQSFGQALFDNENSKDWAQLYAANTFSIFFVTMAFLGLLEKGSREYEDYTSSVINITSASGIIKLAQDHFCYNSSKAAASHLTKVMSTEFGLRNFPIRVNAIAPGAFPSEMTLQDIRPEDVNKINKGIVPAPAGRAGSLQEMVGTAIYLASRAGCYTNGQEIAVDGGVLAVNPSTR